MLCRLRGADAEVSLLIRLAGWAGARERGHRHMRLRFWRSSSGRGAGRPSVCSRTMLSLCLAVLLGSLLAAGTASGQTDATAASDRIAALEKSSADTANKVALAQTAGDNAWMLTSSALVLMMSGPGLALFYGGLVRRKNILGTMMQTFAMMAVITVLWAFLTYSLAFSPG